MILKLFIVMATITLLGGCFSNDKKAEDLLETAKFEEKQNNSEHAIKLYIEIQKNYPTTTAAKEALTRMTVIMSKKP